MKAFILVVITWLILFISYGLASFWIADYPGTGFFAYLFKGPEADFAALGSLYISFFIGVSYLAFSDTTNSERRSRS
jgi:hypothetical protein